VTHKIRKLFRLSFGKIIPALCKLRTHCTRNKQDIDISFAVYYAAHQLFRKHPDPFSCKNKDGKELLGKIINGKAYTSTFDMQKDKVLTKPLPCNAKFDGQEEVSDSKNQESDSPTVEKLRSLAKKTISMQLRLK
jgi:hypothetical protein